MEEMAFDLVGIRGVVGVTLGGSQARGTADAHSDVDLGVYYSPDLDLAELSRLAAAWSTAPVEVHGPGGWGPWVDGGAWLRVDGVAVDWILRDMGRVAEQCARAARGDYAFHAQAGHPLGFLDVAYAGELALGVLLADPEGALAELRPAAYPPALAEALAAGVWEAEFLVGVAEKGLTRGDRAYVLQCLTRALMLCAHGLHAAAGRWVTNEKGLVPAVATLPRAPLAFAERADAALADDPAPAVAAVGVLVTETRALLGT